MNRRSLYIPFFIVFLLNVMVITPVLAEQTSWTEEKIGKLAVKADKAATRKKWDRAIKYGEKMLKASIAFYGSDAPYTITRLKTLNRYYDKAGRLDQIHKQVKRAYFLSKEHFKLIHETATTSRLLYYKSLLSQEDYKNAIPLIIENLSILGDSRNDNFKRLHYLGQLHGIYGLLGQLEKRETILIQQLALNKRLIGDHIDDNIKIVMNLARSYCLQNKTSEFKKLMQTYNLKFQC